MTPILHIRKLKVSDLLNDPQLEGGACPVHHATPLLTERGWESEFKTWSLVNS